MSNESSMKGGESSMEQKNIHKKRKNFENC